MREITDRENTAWSIVKLYYGAFYAGHALMRIIGESCSYFDRNNVNRIGEIFRTVGKNPSFGLDSGLYHCILNITATGLSAKRARGAVGGAHETFWKIFGDRISRLAEQVLTGPLAPEEARQVFGKFVGLTAILSQGGVGQYTWLSTVRNELQYRHKFGVWFPASMRTGEREALGRLSAQWARNPIDVDLGSGKAGSLREFVSACVFIVALCLEMLLWIAERSSVGAQSFARLGPIAFLQNSRLIRIEGYRVITVL
jgi:hypothetical protein